MAAKKSKRPLMTFLSPEQMAAQNPWGGMLQNPTQAAINNSADESQAARKALGVIGQAREDSPVAMDNSREAASPIPLVEQFNQMALIPKGTGPRDTWMDRVTQKNQEQNKITENLYASPEEYNQLVGAVMNTEPVRQQQALLEAQDELAQDVISNYQTGMDLTPLMALTDAWSAKNPNLARAYKAPPGYGEKAKLLLDYGSKMADDRQKLMDKIMSGVQYMKTGTTSTGTLADLAALTQRGQTPAPAPRGSGNRNPSVDANRYLTGFRALPEVKSANEGLMASKEVIKQIENPSWLTDAAAKGSILQAMRMYPISDRDAALVAGAPDVASRAERLVAKLLEGKNFTDADRQTILDYARVKAEAANKSLREAEQRYNAGLASHYGYSPQTAGAITNSAIPAAPPPPPPERNVVLEWLDNKRKERLKK